MRNYYKVEYFKISYNKETDTTTVTPLGKTEINDDNVDWNRPLARKAALYAPAGCSGFDKLTFTLIHK
jgi:hypothetical protein